MNIRGNTGLSHTNPIGYLTGYSEPILYEPKGVRKNYIYGAGGYTFYGDLWKGELLHRGQGWWKQAPFFHIIAGDVLLVHIVPYQEQAPTNGRRGRKRRSERRYHR